MHRVVLGVVFAMLVACTTLVVLPRRTNLPTILVENKSMEVLRVYDEFTRLATIYPGETECIIMYRESVQNLRFHQLSADVWGPDFNPFSAPGWGVTIRNVLWMDVLSLQPADPCE